MKYFQLIQLEIRSLGHLRTGRGSNRRPEEEETQQELLPRQEEEEEEEETHQDLLPQQESRTSRHKQFIGLFQKVTRVHSMIEMFRSWPRICCWRIVHRQQLCDKSDGRECAGPAPGQNPDADADLLLNMLLPVVLTNSSPSSPDLPIAEICPCYPGQAVRSC